MRYGSYESSFGCLRALLHAPGGKMRTDQVLGMICRSAQRWPDRVRQEWMPYVCDHFTRGDDAEVGRARLSSRNPALFRMMLANPSSPAWALVQELALAPISSDHRVSIWNVLRDEECAGIEHLMILGQGRSVRLRSCLPDTRRAPWSLTELTLEAAHLERQDVRVLLELGHLDEVERVVLRGLPLEKDALLDLVESCAALTCVHVARHADDLGVFTDVDQARPEVMVTVGGADALVYRLRDGSSCVRRASSSELHDAPHRRDVIEHVRPRRAT